MKGKKTATQSSPVKQSARPRYQVSPSLLGISAPQARSSSESSEETDLSDVNFI